MQLATLCAVFVNAHRNPQTQAVGVEEFLFRHETLEERRQKQTGRMLDILRAVAKPGKPKRRKRAKGRK